MMTRHSSLTLQLNFAKAALLDSIKGNRDKHQRAFEASYGEYRKLLVATLTTMLRAAETGKPVSHHIALREPQSHIEEYDRAIAMLEMCADEQIELDNVLYAQLVQDEWDWKDDFAATTAFYSGNQ